jgi:hypothetical protein
VSGASPADWAAGGFAGLSAISLIALGLAFADADLAYFDPRPLLARAGDRVLVEVVNARLLLRDAAISLAALLALLTINPEHTS